MNIGPEEGPIYIPAPVEEPILSYDYAKSEFGI